MDLRLGIIPTVAELNMVSFGGEKPREIKKAGE